MKPLFVSKLDRSARRVYTIKWRFRLNLLVVSKVDRSAWTCCAAPRSTGKVVLKTRAHLAERHSYEQRFQELLAILES